MLDLGSPFFLDEDPVEERVTGFVLMSDGTENSLYNHRTQKLASACSKIIGLVGASPTG